MKFREDPMQMSEEQADGLKRVVTFVGILCLRSLWDIYVGKCSADDSTEYRCDQRFYWTQIKSHRTDLSKRCLCSSHSVSVSSHRQ